MSPWKAAAMLAVVFGLYLLASGFDYQDQQDAEASTAERDAQLAMTCLPHAPGETAFITWESAGKLVCLKEFRDGHVRGAVFEGTKWRSM
jgi:hypothetical protein